MSRGKLTVLLCVCVFIGISIIVGFFVRSRRSGDGSATGSVTGTHIPDTVDAPIHDQIQEKLNLASDIFKIFTADLEEMRGIGRVRVLTTYTYSNFFIYEGEAHGYEYNLMEEYRNFLNSGVDRKGMKVEMYYIPLPYDLLIPALNRGYGDIVAANMTIHPERRKEVDFTDPYQWDIKEILLSNDKMEDIESMEQLSGRRIFVREGSSYHMSLSEFNKKLIGLTLQPIDVVTLPGVIHTSDILEMVSADVIPMTVVDDHLAAIAVALLPNLKTHDHIVLNDDVQYGWMVRKSNPQLQASLNRFIRTVKKGTLKGNIYFKRYFEENPWADEALKREDFNTCCLYVPLFKKYGERYGFDWMLLAAQAYQESRFDPDARSSAGAIGLMQVLPKTAREMGIDSIHLPENNIHAGVKYLKWIRDNYFNGQEISGDDRVRFALAAYNAGPRKIRKSRSITAEMGYDSSKWFGHCELGTMKHVGPEPVHYVRSVNKTYLAFHMSKVLSDLRQQRLESRIHL